MRAWQRLFIFIRVVIFAKTLFIHIYILLRYQANASNYYVKLAVLCHNTACLMVFNPYPAVPWICPISTNKVEPDHMASTETIWSGSIIFLLSECLAHQPLWVIPCSPRFKLWIFVLQIIQIWLVDYQKWVLLIKILSRVRVNYEPTFKPVCVLQAFLFWFGS